MLLVASQTIIKSSVSGFGGCIRDLRLTAVSVDLLSVRDLVSVNMDGCPPYHVPNDTCDTGLVKEVYTGYDTIAYDYGLLPYTGDVVAASKL
jgi:hypothetical protein